LHIWVRDVRHYAASQVKPRARILARDNMQPFVKEVRQGVPAGPVSVTFREDVTGLTTDSAYLIRDFQQTSVLHPLPSISGAWTCAAGTGAPVDCATGLLRTATFRPAQPLIPRTDYRFVLNGQGQLGLTDAAGNPLIDTDVMCGCGARAFFTTNG
jgi:hypothetical protein